MAVPSERSWTNMLAGRSPTCEFPRDDPGRTCSTDGPHQQVPAEVPASSRRKIANLQVRAERSWTNMLDGRSAPASSRDTTLDEHPCRKVANLQVPAERR
uniref:(northern house mosquito) hypothetical protein n=1 Tax=Culex pipiens TaxID=7175 RepID=A0A8D8E4G2_CULPI